MNLQLGALGVPNAYVAQFAFGHAHEVIDAGNIGNDTDHAAGHRQAVDIKGGPALSRNTDGHMVRAVSQGGRRSDVLQPMQVAKVAESQMATYTVECQKYVVDVLAVSKVKNVLPIAVDVGNSDPRLDGDVTGQFGVGQRQKAGAGAVKFQRCNCICIGHRDGVAVGGVEHEGRVFVKALSGAWLGGDRHVVDGGNAQAERHGCGAAVKHAQRVSAEVIGCGAVDQAVDGRVNGRRGTCEGNGVGAVAAVSDARRGAQHQLAEADFEGVGKGGAAAVGHHQLVVVAAGKQQRGVFKKALGQVIGGHDGLTFEWSGKLTGQLIKGG